MNTTRLLLSAIALLCVWLVLHTPAAGETLYSPEDYCKVTNVTGSDVDALIGYYSVSPGGVVNNTVAADNSTDILVPASELEECFFLDGVDARNLVPVFVVEGTSDIATMVEALNITEGKNLISFVERFSGAESIPDYCARVLSGNATSTGVMEQFVDLGCYFYASSQAASYTDDDVIEGTTDDTIVSQGISINTTLFFDRISSLTGILDAFRIPHGFDFNYTQAKQSVEEATARALTDDTTVQATQTLFKKASGRRLPSDSCPVVPLDATEVRVRLDQKTAYITERLTRQATRSFMELKLVKNLFPALAQVARAPDFHRDLVRQMNTTRDEGKISTLNDMLEGVGRLVNAAHDSIKKNDPEKNEKIVAGIRRLIAFVAHESTHNELLGRKLHDGLAQPDIRYGNTYLNGWMKAERRKRGLLPGQQAGRQSSFSLAHPSSRLSTGSKHNGAKKAWGGQTIGRYVSFLYFFKKTAKAPFEGYAPWENHELDIFSITDLAVYLNHLTVKWFITNTMETRAQCLYPFPLIPDSSNDCEAVEIAPLPEIAYPEGFDPDNTECEAYSDWQLQLKTYWYIVTGPLFYEIVTRFSGMHVFLDPLMYSPDKTGPPAGVMVCLVLNLQVPVIVSMIASGILLALCVLLDLKFQVEAEQHRDSLEDRVRSMLAQFAMTNEAIDMLAADGSKRDSQLVLMRSQINQLYDNN
jgi:hypothetical protein